MFKSGLTLLILTALVLVAQNSVVATANSESIDIDTVADAENRIGEDGPEQPTPTHSAAVVPPAGLDLPQLWSLLSKIEYKQEEFDGEIKRLASTLNESLGSARAEWSRAAVKRQNDIEQMGRGLRKLKQDAEDEGMKMARISRRLGQLRTAANESLARADAMERNLRAVDTNTAALRNQQNQVTVSLNALTRLVQDTRSGLSARIARLENPYGGSSQPGPYLYPATTTPAPSRITTTASPGCGGIFTAASGSLRYPVTYGNYLSNMHCTWVITAPPGKFIIIRFQRFSLEWGSSCQHDYLEIRNGNGARLHIFCGVETPLGGHPVSVSGSTSLIFRSDSSVTGEGFTLTWELANQAVDPPPPVACGGALGAEGSLKYPNFGNYENNLDCNWTLTAPEGKLIRMQFTRIRMQSGVGCLTDWVKPQTEGNTLAKYCSANYQGTSPPFLSLNSTLNVAFHSDSSETGAGFELHWRSIDKRSVNRLYFHNADWVHTLVQSGVGAMTSPPGGAPRSQGLSVVYEFLSSTTVTHVTVQASATVCPLVVGPTCKYENTATFETSTNRSWVMKTDGVHAQKQGSMDLSEVDPEGPVYPWTVTPPCGGSFNTSLGTIRHPREGVSLYDDNEDCTWTITVPPGRRIYLTFQSFELENSETCSYDWLEIRESSGFGRSLGKFCGLILPRGAGGRPLESFGNHLRLVFHSDGSGQRRGFELSWTAVGGPDPVSVTTTSNNSTVEPEPVIVTVENLTATTTMDSLFEGSGTSVEPETVTPDNSTPDADIESGSGMEPEPVIVTVDVEDTTMESVFEGSGSGIEPDTVTPDNGTLIADKLF